MSNQERFSTQEIWTSVLTGQATGREMDTLIEAVDANPQLASEYRADARIHRLICASDRIPRDDEAFVEAVLRRCESPALNDESTEDEPEVWFAEAPSSCVVTNEMAIPASCVDLDDDDSLSDGLPVVNREPTLNASRRRPAWRSGGSIVVVLVVFFAGVLSGLYWRGDQRGSAVDDGSAGRVAQLHDPPPEDRTGSDASSVPSQPEAGLASLTNVSDGQWATPRVEQERLFAGPLRLLRGHGEIRFDDGAVVSLEGPADVRLLADHQVLLDHGQLSSLRPAGARPVRISTPASSAIENVSGDECARYSVAVDDFGSTELEVFSGAVDVEPLVSGPDRPERWTLSGDRLNQATFVQSKPRGNRRSVLASARSTEGDFEGVVSLDGESVTFDSEPAFNRLLNDMVAQFRRHPDSLVRDWPLVKQTMTGVLQHGGSINLNGQPAEIADILKLIPSRPADGNEESQQTGSFQGTINVNGETQTFTTRNEFDAAVKGLFPQDALLPITIPAPLIPKEASEPDESGTPAPKPADGFDGPVNPFLPDSNDT
ncbi:MAG: FecR family protein [Planctomycetota bacterium]|jgi:hypothetical protein